VSRLIVETTGIPGSGKTTVTNLLAGELERRGSASWTAKEQLGAAESSYRECLEAVLKRARLAGLDQS
jgi:thymidylate kinase